MTAVSFYFSIMLGRGENHCAITKLMKFTKPNTVKTFTTAADKK